VSVEVLDYRLEVRGVPAGRHVLRSEEQGRDARADGARRASVRLEGEATFEGPLGPARVLQLSRCDADLMTSREFRETTVDRSGERRTRIEFDEGDGLVRMRRGDELAETPYLTSFRDPLSMLRELRRADAAAQRIRIPMLGKVVEARSLGMVELTTELGPKQARAYQLHPGGSWLWIDAEPPHPILKLTQRTPDGLVDALLVKIAHGTELPGWDAEEGRGGTKKRSKRRRRRRGRGGRSRSRKNE